MIGTNRRELLRFGGALLGGIAVGSRVTAAARTDRFVVETRGNREPRDIDVIHEMPWVDVAVVRGSEQTVTESPAVRKAVPDIGMRLDAPDANEDVPTFDASDYEGQPGDFLQWDKADLRVPEAHDTTEGEGTRVSVIDSGVLESHPDLAGPLNVDLSRNFTDDGGDHNPVGDDDHGTHVAGIVAADNSAGLGVNGTAPKTDLVDCRVFSGPFATFGDILAAVLYSALPADEEMTVNGEVVGGADADVANLSLGAFPVTRKPGEDGDDENSGKEGYGSFYGKVLNRVMTYANRQGTLLVTAAGNDSFDLQTDNDYVVEVDTDGDGEPDEEMLLRSITSLPNEGAQAVSVAATGPIGYGWDESAFGISGSPPESPAFYTNYGTNTITLGAPGGDAHLPAIGTGVDWFNDLVFNTAFSLDANGDQVPGYAWMAGTSMAAPNVAGAAALVKSANPDYNANQVESALKRAADVPDDYEKTYYGSGYLNILDAL